MSEIGSLCEYRTPANRAWTINSDDNSREQSLLQNPLFRESKRNRIEHEYESEREHRSILQEAHKTNFMYHFKVGRAAWPRLRWQEVLAFGVLGNQPRTLRVGQKPHDGRRKTVVGQISYENRAIID